jgi:catechol 2,3-dioxygenase-like lactoylglutathione lyase family enzyme
MDWKLELVAVPVSDVDRAKAFYVEQAGFVADHDHVVTEELRFVQLTPPGSACSIASLIAAGARTLAQASGHRAAASIAQRETRRMPNGLGW